MARISVIVPAYNVEEYLADCLDSVLDQGVDDLEVVVVDDGSTDTGPRRRYFLAFVDSDDRLPENALGRLLSVLDATGSDFATRAQRPARRAPPIRRDARLRRPALPPRRARAGRRRVPRGVHGARGRLPGDRRTRRGGPLPAMQRRKWRLVREERLDELLAVLEQPPVRVRGVDFLARRARQALTAFRPARVPPSVPPTPAVQELRQPAQQLRRAG